jgi:hypothetical protein
LRLSTHLLNQNTRFHRASFRQLIHFFWAASSFLAFSSAADDGVRSRRPVFPASSLFALKGLNNPAQGKRLAPPWEHDGQSNRRTL